MPKQPFHHNHQRSDAGFTLIEMLVSTAIFVIVVTALASVIVYVLKLQRHTNAIRTANDNVRYLSDFLSKEIRNGTLNFDGSAAVLTGCSTYSQNGGTNTQYWIQLRNISGDEECIFLSDDGTSATSTGHYVWITKQLAGTTTPLAPQQLTIGSAQVTGLTFTVAHPEVSGGTSNSDDQQPYIIIQGIVVSNKDPQNIVSVPFETSVALPIYGLQAT